MGLLFIKIFGGFVIAPVVYFVLYGTARIGANAVRRHMPECWLKQKLLTDPETGKLDYIPPDADSKPRR